MDEFDHVGEWVARVGRDDPMAENPLTKYHRVESRIESRFVIHCGHQMAWSIPSRLGTRLVFEPNVDASVKCLRC